MNVENEIKYIQSTLSVIAASMCFRSDLPNDLYNRAYKLQKASRIALERDLIKSEAYRKYTTMKLEIAALEEDYPEFKSGI